MLFLLIPEIDIVLIHTLMFEADEETCLQTSNRFASLCISLRDDEANSPLLHEMTRYQTLPELAILLALE